MFILSPGHKTPWMSLNDAAHEARENVRTQRQKQVADRKTAGVPESDDTDYLAITQNLIKAQKACETGADGQIVECLGEIRDSLGSRVTVPDPYKKDPDLDALEVQCTSLSRSQYSDLCAPAWSALAMGDSGPVKELLTLCIAVRGFDVEGSLEGVDLWEEADLLWQLLQITVRFQEMSHAEKKLYGSQAEST